MGRGRHDIRKTTSAKVCSKSVTGAKTMFKIPLKVPPNKAPTLLVTFQSPEIAALPSPPGPHPEFARVHQVVSQASLIMPRFLSTSS